MFKPERLIEWRKKKKLTQEQLAQKVQTTKGTISNYENGHSTPPHETLVAIADVLGISTDYLLGRTDDPTPPSQAKGVVSDYSPFLRAIKEKYPGVNIDDPDVQRKLMRAIDLVLEDYLENKKRKQ